MTDSNKRNIKEFAKVLALFILGFLAIITNVEIWNCASNGATDGFHVWVSILNFIFEGFAIFEVWKWLFKKKNNS